ncbi:MAG: DNA mismatch repair protein MutT [Alphaproteobacteria bacterium HGW-Alphaproteobacteria-18]|nr:MAG: DNA mismatch repair protein MutT [Alphaproteobacteria bacterium HGW-Alphaproteobacteria-18]
MRLIKKLVHPGVKDLTGAILTRRAARGIVLREMSILLLFTERYNDFSFPGGGVADGEDLIEGLRRELEEETGACNVRVRRDYGCIEELRPHWKPGFALMHMTSHFYFCDTDPELRAPRMEGYELANGMRPIWVNLDEAIAHNRAVLARQEASIGLSIQRETFMLEKLAEDLETPAWSGLRNLDQAFLG